MSDEVFCIHYGQPTAASGRFCRGCDADQSPDTEKSSPQSRSSVPPQSPAVLLSTQARQMVGGILVFVGAACVFYGISHQNSTGSQLANALGQKDESGVISITIGILTGTLGIVIFTMKSIVEIESKDAYSSKPSPNIPKCLRCSKPLHSSGRCTACDGVV